MKNMTSIHMISFRLHPTLELQLLVQALTKPFKNAYNNASQQQKVSKHQYRGQGHSWSDKHCFSRICHTELTRFVFLCTEICLPSCNIFNYLDFSISFADQLDITDKIKPPEVELDSSTAPKSNLSVRTNQRQTEVTTSISFVSEDSSLITAGKDFSKGIRIKTYFEENFPTSQYCQYKI